MVFSPAKTLWGGLIVGVVGAHWAVHGDLLEKVAGNHEKVGVFSSDAPLFPAALRVCFAMDGRRGVVFGHGCSHRRRREGLLPNGLLRCACCAVAVTGPTVIAAPRRQKRRRGGRFAAKKQKNGSDSPVTV